MYIVEGGIYTDTQFDKLEDGTTEKYGPFETYEEAEIEWSGRSRSKLDICCHRLFIRKQ